MDKVLIAEDDLKLQRFLHARLQKHKSEFEVLLACDGEQAIEVLKRERVSVLIADLVMPKVDGLELLSYISENYPEIPCIVMSAHATPEMEEGFSEETFRFFRKPFHLGELVQAIIQALNPDIPSGSLKGISVASFLQMVKMEQKTCFLEIIPADGEKGHFYFEHGELYDASYRNLKGEEAAFKMITMDKAKIRFRELPKKEFAKRINTELTGLIMEATRRKEESVG